MCEQSEGGGGRWSIVNVWTLDSLEGEGGRGSIVNV